MINTIVFMTERLNYQYTIEYQYVLDITSFDKSGKNQKRISCLNFLRPQLTILGRTINHSVQSLNTKMTPQHEFDRNNFQVIEE